MLLIPGNMANGICPFEHLARQHLYDAEPEVVIGVLHYEGNIWIVGR